mgnify:FL=1
MNFSDRAKQQYRRDFYTVSNAPRSTSGALKQDILSVYKTRTFLSETRAYLSDRRGSTKKFKRYAKLRIKTPYIKLCVALKYSKVVRLSAKCLTVCLVVIIAKKNLKKSKCRLKHEKMTEKDTEVQETQANGLTYCQEYGGGRTGRD